MRVLYCLGPAWDNQDLVSAKLLALPPGTSITKIPPRGNFHLYLYRADPDVVWVFSDEMFADGTAKLLDIAAEKLIPGLNVHSDGEVKYGW